MRPPLLLASSLRSLSRSNSKRRFSSIVVKDDNVHIDALKASFPLIWLRDSCQCPRCVHPSTRQKLHRSSDFSSPSAGKARSLKTEKVETTDKGLRVQWMEEGGHTSFFPSDFLLRYSSPSVLASFHRDISAKPWMASHLSHFAPFKYSELSDPKVLLEVYQNLLRDGLVFFRGVPTEKTTNEDCELRVLGERLGTFRKTFYGETWDVQNVKDSKNIAYTNLDLSFHMDLLCVTFFFSFS